MKNKVLENLNGKKSIRAQMVWAFVLSLALATLVSNFVNFNFIRSDYYILKIPLALGSYFALFLFFFYLFTRHIIKHFRIITDGLKLIASGDLNYRLPSDRQDELGMVARNINHMAEQLQNQLDRERQLEKSKMELITYVSHDLRTPLTSIIGYLNLLKTRTYRDQQEQERYIDNAFNKTQQLKKLIDDLFEYTRLTNGDVRLSVQTVDFGSLLEQMVIEFEPVAKEQGITITASLHEEPAVVCIDIEKIVRSIDNLLINALKFSFKPGEIKVRLIVREGQAILSIENAGEPISKEVEAQLFDRFYKVDSARNDANRMSGSGLGLSIAQNIIELHDGRIWLRHDHGVYRFFIALPLQPRES